MIGTLDKSHCEMVLGLNYIGRVGCHTQGRTYVVPVTYVYEDGYVLSFTKEGQKVRMMRENPDVCFEVDVIDDIARWQSVIAWGKYEELSGEDAVKALDRIVQRLLPLAASSKDESQRPRELEHYLKAIQLSRDKGVIYRIRLDEMSGRFERSDRCS